jgi:hypothetical protein
MSAGPNPPVDLQTLEQTRRHINRLIEEVARMAEADLGPGEFYAEMLKRVLTAMAAPAGAVWVRTAQGNLQLQFHINLREVGIDRTDAGRQAHDELLRQAVTNPQPIHLLPHSGFGAVEGEKGAAGNPTDFMLLLVPIHFNNQVHGLIEVWQSPDRPLNAVPGFLQFMVTMADLSARFIRNQTMGQLAGQQQLWIQLEAFARQVHASLNPTEVAYQVANEGRRLIDCDRVSVGVRMGRKIRVEAVSGNDIVERRSNLVQLMRKLFDAVLKWGEKLVYNGTKDDSLPPAVLHALDHYLAESNSKFLVVMPLKDEEREKESKKPPRSALLMECFETTGDTTQLQGRLDVVGKHAATALYNAVEHKRIPMRFLWMPLAKIQEGLGGKARAIMLLIFLLIAGLTAAMIFIPYPLKMEAIGQLLPEARRYVYSPVEGEVKKFLVNPGDKVDENQPLVLMFDQQLQLTLIRLLNERNGAKRQAEAIEAQIGQAPADRRAALVAEREQQQAIFEVKAKEIDAIVRRANAIEFDGQLGYFYVMSPKLPPGGEKWTVLTGDFIEKLTSMTVKPSDPLLRLGVKEGEWEIEAKIPQKHIGQILHAFDKLGVQELDVDLLVRSDPTRTFKGRLHRSRIANEANPQHNENQEAEPVVLAYVRIDDDDIPAASRVPGKLHVTGIEVVCKARCGNHALGYSLFYGVWEFIYEKIVFFF